MSAQTADSGLTVFIISGEGQEFQALWSSATLDEDGFFYMLEFSY